MRRTVDDVDRLVRSGFMTNDRPPPPPSAKCPGDALVIHLCEGFGGVCRPVGNTLYARDPMSWREAQQQRHGEATLLATESLLSVCTRTPYISRIMCAEHLQAMPCCELQLADVVDGRPLDREIENDTQEPSLAERAACCNAPPALGLNSEDTHA
jgi:hypothetical protein